MQATAPKVHLLLKILVFYYVDAAPFAIRVTLVAVLTATSSIRLRLATVDLRLLLVSRVNISHVYNYNIGNWKCCEPHILRDLIKDFI